MEKRSVNRALIRLKRRRLTVTDVTLMGFFDRESAAKAAEKNLREQQFEVVQLSEVSPYPGDNASDLDNPISELMESLATEVLEAETGGPDEQVLLASSPDASGMEDGEHHHSAENWLVTVVSPRERHEEAKRILEQHGARL